MRVLTGAADGEETLSVALWANTAALEVLGLDWAAALADFSAWAGMAEPAQGWVADCAWIPLFNTYEDFHMTPYEVVGADRGAGMAGSPRRG